jgi:hypothetical protein
MSIWIQFHWLTFVEPICLALKEFPIQLMIMWMAGFPHSSMILKKLQSLDCLLTTDGRCAKSKTDTFHTYISEITYIHI